MKEIKINKIDLRDKMGRPLTQSLFLEIAYSDFAIFTLNDEDKEYNGKTYYSLKKLFLECEDPTEYEFARRYLLGWKHWMRLNENKQLRPHFDQWREELELSIRSMGLRQIIDFATDEKGFQAAKFLVEKGWTDKRVGRPSKADIDGERKQRANLNDLYSEDLEFIKDKIKVVK